MNPGERVLLRLANLGYQQHAMELPGIPMHVVGQDASLLRDGGDRHLVLARTRSTSAPARPATCSFDAPAYNAARPSGIGRRGSVQRLLLQEPGLAPAVELRRAAAEAGGMMTEVRVYQTPAAAADRREPDLCLSRRRRCAAEGRPR